MKKCPRGTEIQSVLFSTDQWTARDARGWLLAHQFLAPRVDRTKNYLHYRQDPPGRFVKSSIRTIDLEARKGIKALVGCPKKKTNPKKKKTQTFKIPKVTAILGKLRELAVEKPTGDLAILKFPIRRSQKSKPTILLSDDAGQNLLAVSCPFRNANLSRLKNRNLEKAINTFENWSNFQADKILRLNVAPKKIKQIGRVLHIVYRSDKYNGRNIDYIHTFKQPPIIWADKISKPSFVGISGGRLKITARGIEG